MSLSFNEIEAIALKAVRGAGATWGLAEEAAFAARWLAQHGADWSGAILGRCEAVTDEGVTLDAEGISGARLCPLRVGAFIADTGLSASALLIRHVTVPLLLLPFLARASAASAVAVRVGDAAPVWIIEGRLCAAPDALAFPAIAAVEIVQAAPPSGVAPLPVLLRPLPVGSVPLEALAAFERRTYVPASAQSRLAGAGAGLSDND